MLLLLFGCCHFRRHHEVWVQFIPVRWIPQDIGLLIYIHCVPVWKIASILFVILLCFSITFYFSYYITLCFYRFYHIPNDILLQLCLCISPKKGYIYNQEHSPIFIQGFQHQTSNLFSILQYCLRNFFQIYHFLPFLIYCCIVFIQVMPFSRT